MNSPEVSGPEPPRPGADSRAQLLQWAERDGCEVALEVAIACGVGLVGDGARAALRAFVVNTLSTTPPTQVTFVVPRGDVVDLLELGVGGSALPTSPLPPLPFGLMVTGSFDDALEVLKREALMRALVRSRQKRTRWTPTMVLAASTCPHRRERLETVLDLGSGYGVAAIVAGRWRAGSTVHVWSTGQVSAPGPGLGRVMHQAWLGTTNAARALEQLTDIARRELERHASPGSPGQ